MKIEPFQQEGYELFQAGLIEFAHVESNGIRIDIERLEKTKKKLHEQCRILKEEMEVMKLWSLWRKRFGAKANLTSLPQLGKVLVEDLDFDIQDKTATGRPKMDEEALQKIDHPFIKPFSRYLKYDKALGTFLKGIEREIVNGRLHPVFNLHTARSFRSSSDSPNFQNFPVRDKEIAKIIRSLFIASEDSVLVENDFKGIEVALSACLPAEQKVETLDGAQSILHVIKRVKKGDKVYVYGYDFNKKRICLARVRGGGKTKTDASLMELTLDDGEKIVATPNHRFLLRDGSYRELKDLREGDSLMPLYRKKVVSQWKTVYEKVYLNNGESILVHNLVALDLHGVVIKGSNKIVHHWDHNGTNNSDDNLLITTRKHHMKIHSVEGWKNKGMGKRMTGWWNTAQAKKMNQERSETWTEKDWDDFGKRVSDGIKRKGGRKGELNAMFGRNHSEDTIAKISESRKGQPSHFKGKHHSEETKRKLSLAMTGKPGYWKGKHIPPPSEETRKKMSLAGLGRKHREESIQKMSAGKLDYWKEKKKQKPSSKCPVCGRVFMLIGSHMRHKHDGAPFNHKVVSVRSLKRKAVVYNLDVEGCHNFVAGGVIVKNSYHKDPNFISYITTPGKDMHKDMAAQLYMIDPEDVSKDARYGAKNKFVFPQFYGDFYVTCAKSLWDWIGKGKLVMPDGTPLMKNLHSKGIKSLGACDAEQRPKKGTFEHHVQGVENDFWNNRFKGYGQWKRDWYNEYLDKGYFDLLTGFRISGMMKKNQVTNLPVQGSAFHCLLWSLIKINWYLRKYNFKSKIVGQIHDSLIGDVKTKELLSYLEIVEQVTTVDLPKHYKWLVVSPEIEYEIAPEGASWFEKREFKFIEGKFLHPSEKYKYTTDTRTFLEIIAI